MVKKMPDPNQLWLDFTAAAADVRKSLETLEGAHKALQAAEVSDRARQRAAENLDALQAEVTRRLQFAARLHFNGNRQAAYCALYDKLFRSTGFHPSSCTDPARSRKKSLLTICREKGFLRELELCSRTLVRGL